MFGEMERSSASTVLVTRMHRPLPPLYVPEMRSATDDGQDGTPTRPCKERLTRVPRPLTVRGVGAYFGHRSLRLALAVAFVSVLVALLGVASALGNTQVGAIWQTTTDQGWKGTRVTVNNPDSSQRLLSSGDFFSTAAYADSGPNGSSLIQTGVNYEWNAPEGPSCNLGSAGATLYYFVETEHTGTYKCYSKGLADSGGSHKQSVFIGGDGLWHAARDGIDENITTSWTGCNGDACTLIALGENLSGKIGLWEAKFAGSGNTPWQFMNSCCWNTINNTPFMPIPNHWSGDGVGNDPSGPFPTGIWSYKYSF